MKLFYKQVGCSFRVLLILLLVVLFATGCEQKPKFEKGFGYTFTPDEIMMGARSNTDSFAKNSVTFEIGYGMHDMDYDDKYGTDPRANYLKDNYKDILFGLYICNIDHTVDVINDMEVSNYKRIDNHYFVKEISEEEAFSEEYGFTMSYGKGMTYNHIEEITIPTDFFVGERGGFVIKIISFLVPLTEEDPYYISVARYIEFEYETLDDNTIKIIFNY